MNAYRYSVEFDDFDCDCTKMEHFAIPLDPASGRETIHLDYSPYRDPSKEVLALWERIGFPDRTRMKELGVSKGIGPVYDKDIRHAYMMLMGQDL